MANCASFFAGVGGIDKGFENTGFFHTVYANEIDSFPARTFELNFPHVQVDVRSITEVQADQIPDVDVIMGGFPCQAFSIAGYRQGFNDERGRGLLFFDIMRIIHDKPEGHKPHVLFLENVKNLQSHNNGETFQVILQALQDEGYYPTYKVLNACEYGNVPQNRERIYIVAFDNERDRDNFNFPEPAELEKIKYAYKRFLQGASLRAISLEFFQNAKSTDDAQTFLKRASKLGRFLRHYEYTGKVLNMEGLEILHKFENNEIPDLHELLEDKYWVNHQFYTEKVISLKDWIKVREKLQENKRIKADGKMRASRFSLGTGLLECPVCKEKYFYHVAKISNKEYFSYYHKKLLNSTFCSNIKNIAQRKLDNILKHFYFYFNLYFDNSKQVYETAREQARLQKIELESEDKKIKKQISLIKNQINKLNKALDTTDEVEEIKILAKQVAKKEDELLKLNNDEISNKILLDEVIEKYKVNDYKSSMTSLKDRILEFFFSYDDRRRHDELQHYKYYLYDKVVVILANTTLFVYSRKSEYIFDESLLDMIKNNFDNFMKISSPFGYGSPLFFGDTIYFNSYVNSIFNFDTELLKNYKYNSGVITYKDSKGNTKIMFFKDEEKA